MRICAKRAFETCVQVPPDFMSIYHYILLACPPEGIDCALFGENFVGTYWLLSNAEGGVKLKVGECDAEMARQILTAKEEVVQEQTEVQGEAEQRDEDSGEPLCPKCGSDLVEYEKYSRKMFFLGILFFRIPVPFPKDSYRCLDCGHVWR